MEDYKIKDVVDIHGNSVMPKTIASAVMIDEGNVEDRIKGLERVIDNLDLSSIPTKADRVHTHNYNDVIVSENTDGNKINIVDYVEERLNTKAEKVHSHSNYLTDIPNSYVQRDELVGYAVRNHTHTKSQIVDLVIPDFSSKADKIHVHEISDINGLQEELDKKTNSEGLVSTTTFNSTVNSIQVELNKKANLIHQHAIADINKLQETLDKKSAIGHIHSYNDLLDKPTIPDVSNKSDVGHKHTLEDITNLSEIGVQSHTHSYNDLTDKPTIPDISTKADRVHTHLQSEVQGLESALSSINTAISSLVTSNIYNTFTMELENDNFTVTLKDKTETNDPKSLSLVQSGKIKMADLNEELTTTINSKANTSDLSSIIETHLVQTPHEHSIKSIYVNPELRDEEGNITQAKETLEDVLARKSNVGHTHEISYIENLHPVLRLLSIKVEDALKRIRVIEAQLNIPSTECTDQVMSDVYPEMNEGNITQQDTSNLDDSL